MQDCGLSWHCTIKISQGNPYLIDGFDGQQVTDIAQVVALVLKWDLHNNQKERKEDKYQ